MSTLKQKSRFVCALGALSIAATLAACGGSDDDAPGVAVVALPAAGTSTGLTSPGTLNYFVFTPDGTNLPSVPAVVAYTAPTGRLTLSEDADALVIATSDAWVTPQWPSGVTGLLALDGLAGLICDTADNSGEVGISGNLVQVTDLAVLRGKSFQFNECAGGGVLASDVIAFNQDGSALLAESDDTDFVMTAADVTAYFSEAGWSIDGGIFKGRAFVRTTSTGQKEYVIADISDDLQDGSRIKTVALFVEVPAPQ